MPIERIECDACSACNGYGFLITTYDNQPPSVVTKCDACNPDGPTDDILLDIVCDLARECIDTCDTAGRNRLLAELR